MQENMGEIVAWVTHGFRRRGIDFNARAVALIFALILVIGLLGAARLYLVSQVAAAGRHLQQVRAELNRLQRENATLEMEIAQKRSVSVLMERARQMGLEPVQRVEFVDR
ncbi:MAG: hypothetical protein PVI59_03505 [Anaerolineae bacterium]|jgi:cell division protein FtsB